MSELVPVHRWLENRYNVSNSFPAFLRMCHFKPKQNPLADDSLRVYFCRRHFLRKGKSCIVALNSHLYVNTTSRRCSISSRTRCQKNSKMISILRQIDEIGRKSPEFIQEWMLMPVFRLISMNTYQLIDRTSTTLFFPKTIHVRWVQE